uniref:Secreted protein n=1 Tax=Loa loa TaxID=7209 RepID=A0A1I7VT55_LOALO
MQSVMMSWSPSAFLARYKTSSWRILFKDFAQLNQMQNIQVLPCIPFSQKLVVICRPERIFGPSRYHYASSFAYVHALLLDLHLFHVPSVGYSIHRQNTAKDKGKRC